MIKDLLNWRKHIAAVIFLLGIQVAASAQVNAKIPLIEFYAADTALQQAFYRARAMALSYKGDAGDPVGPWYEAALPSRNAFCIRDVSHQSIAAEALGMGRENKNMLTHFVSNISAAKDWCTYWEMNKYGLPAPEDYRNDTAFWYNLNANFELINTCWRLYQWTGDTSYIVHPAFRSFFEATVHTYIDHWFLQVDSLLKRPPYPNAPSPFNIKDNFHRCRGIPSYYESVGDMMMSADLVAAIYRAMKSYAAMAAWRGDHSSAATYNIKAESYRQHLEMYWWDQTADKYHTYFTNKGAFGKGEGETFLLWYDALQDSSRLRKTIRELTRASLNVENLSYLPFQMSRFGYWKEAYQYMLHLANPATKRREYPEVSFGVIEGIVQGVMGVDADASQHRITTVFNQAAVRQAEIRHLPVLSGNLQLMHWDKGSTLTFQGEKEITWRAAFHGRIPEIEVSGRKMKATHQIDTLGNWISYVDIQVLPGKNTTAIIH